MLYRDVAMLFIKTHSSGGSEALQELLSQVGKLIHFFMMQVERAGKR